MAPAVAISMDSEIYENAEMFDALRFYKMRERSEGDASQYQLASIGKHMLHFGAGRRSCPGRHLASYESKVLLAKLMIKYDFKLKEGEERPKSILHQNMNMPNPTAAILFKKRQI